MLCVRGRNLFRSVTSAPPASQGKFYPRELLVSVASTDLPYGVKENEREKYLNDSDFQKVLGMNKAAFAALPPYKQVMAKTKAKLL